MCNYLANGNVIIPNRLQHFGVDSFADHPLPPHYRSATPERSRDFNYLKDNWTLITSAKFLYRFCIDWMNVVEKQDFNT